MMHKKVLLFFESKKPTMVFRIFFILVFCLLFCDCTCRSCMKLNYFYNNIVPIETCSDEKIQKDFIFLDQHNICYFVANKHFDTSVEFVYQTPTNCIYKKVEPDFKGSFEINISRVYKLSPTKLLYSMSVNYTPDSNKTGNRNYFISVENNNISIEYIENDSSGYFSMTQSAINNKLFYGRPNHSSDLKFIYIDPANYWESNYVWDYSNDTNFFHGIDTTLNVYRDKDEKQTFYFEFTNTNTNDLIAKYKIDSLSPNLSTLISPNRRYIASSSYYNGFYILDLKEKVIYNRIIETVHHGMCIATAQPISWSEDSNKLILAAKDICIVDIDQLLQEYKKNKPIKHFDRIL